MILKNIEIIKTEIGRIVVSVNETFKDGKFQFEGKILDINMDEILIITPTKESCLEGLKIAFEVHLHIWLCGELLPTNIKLSNE